MRKEEAIAVLNEIMKTCMFPRSVALNLTNPQAEMEKQRYELQIRGGLNSRDWECIKRIVQKRGLEMKETNDFVVIYSMKPGRA